jgi:hypothetical protein
MKVIKLVCWNSEELTKLEQAKNRIDSCTYDGYKITWQRC